MRKKERKKKERKRKAISLKEIEFKNQTWVRPSLVFDPSNNFDVTKHIRLVPPFRERKRLKSTF